MEPLIAQGNVIVNGDVCTKLATQIGEGDVVEVDGQRIRPEGTMSVMFYKPPGPVCTRHDEHGRMTIYDILPKEYHNLNYVGRLDRESEGLLVLTNDGDLSNRLAHPRYKVEKEYDVILDRNFDKRFIQKMLDGIEIPEGMARADKVEQHAGKRLTIILTQGLKRQIREMFASLGYEVTHLVRVRTGRLTLGELRPRKMAPPFRERPHGIAALGETGNLIASTKSAAAFAADCGFCPVTRFPSRTEFSVKSGAAFTMA